MRPRQLPHIWLMTDERMGDSLPAALEALPRGAGIVFRHHATPPRARKALFDRVRAIARRRGLVMVLAGPPLCAIAWRADGAHGPSPHKRASRMLLRTASAHSAREIVLRARSADLLFLSPVFATRSHPGARALGPIRFGMLVRGAPCPIAALGGMNTKRARRIARFGGHGWAAIDGLLPRASPAAP